VVAQSTWQFSEDERITRIEVFRRSEVTGEKEAGHIQETKKALLILFHIMLFLSKIFMPLTVYTRKSSITYNATI